MVRFAPVPTVGDAMDVLRVWPSPSPMVTVEVAMVVERPLSDAYRWLMWLATHGYLTRRPVAGPRSRRIQWSLTPKGLVTMIELKRRIA